MKNILTFSLALFLLMYAASASAMAEPLVGGWTVPESSAITPELQEIFDSALEGLVGVSYKPVALLGTQVVAGMNYRFLCEADVLYPHTEPYYATVTVYRDLQGNAIVTSINKEETNTQEEIEAYGNSAVSERQTPDNTVTFQNGKYHWSGLPVPTKFSRSK